MPDRVILFRHGEIEAKYHLKFIGSTDAALSAEGREQMKKFQPFAGEYKKAFFLYSPQIRAVESYILATGGMQVDARGESIFREIDFGEWETLSFLEIQERFPEEYGQWEKWNPDFTYPGGESHQNLLHRAKQCAEMIRGISRKTVVVFSHGGLLRFLVCELLGLDPAFYQNFRILRGTRTTVDISMERGILEEINYRPR